MDATKLTIDLGQPGKPISPDLFGIFFEDLNSAADGGLYAELVQNRSFEYQATEQPDWNNLTTWELVMRSGGKGKVWIDAAFLIHPNNPHYAVVEIEEAGDGVGLINPGFDGMVIQAGEKYHLSFLGRLLYVGNRWSASGNSDPGSMPVVVQLESKDGTALGEASFDVCCQKWERHAATITATASDPAARLVVLAKVKGAILLDDVSLFPEKTFRSRANGLRADLAQAIADLKPRFMRFPGGCLVHGNGLGNMYRWKDTIGPIEQRRQQANLWGYHQSVGLGYFEYFQFCEDIGAKPLPVVAAGVCCQNSGRTGGAGQEALPLEQMPEYIQEVLDLIEWANGPADSPWGAKRAAAGHPASFNLEYLGVGNEDHITPAFRERFEMIYEAVKMKHPEITVIGTSGPFHSGPDYDKGWKIADELKIPMVDEHYYEKREWFLGNLDFYDGYDRNKSKVYLGEYAVHDEERRSTLRSAIAEAAYLTGLERNGDIVSMASYAPLLGKIGCTQWKPDLIYFTNTQVHPTISYYVQQMFSLNAGDTWLPASVSDQKDLAVSVVRDSKSGDLICKLVNYGTSSKSLKVELSGATNLAADATRTVLAGDPLAVNDPEAAQPVLPQTSAISIGSAFDYEAPANSLTVIRIPSRKT